MMMTRMLIGLAWAYLMLSTLAAQSFPLPRAEYHHLQRVLNRLEGITSASFRVTNEVWNHGDTAATFVGRRYVESYRNPADTSIGSSWADFDSPAKSLLKFAYDGAARILVHDDVREIIIDSFQVRWLPFRPVSPPFFNYTEHIIRYILNNQDSTSLLKKDLGDAFYYRQTIHADRQVEFFGKPHYMPENPNLFDPTSIYEIWIDKKTDLPTKVRREMSHSISVVAVSDYTFNQLKLVDFKASDHFPRDYAIKPYGQAKPPERPHPLIGQKAPAWILQSDQKEITALTYFRDKALLIQFTSVNCGPCKASIPLMNALATAYPKDQLEVVAIECSAKHTEVVNDYIHRNGLNYPLLMSSKSVMEAYAIRSYPVFFLLDKTHNIVQVIDGYDQQTSEREIRWGIEKILE